MKIVLVSICCLFILSRSDGLELNLDLNRPSSSGHRAPCGVLTCEASHTADISNTTAREMTSYHTISSMSIFKTKQFSHSGDVSPLRGDPLAVLTPQQPKIIRVSDGVKVDGVLEIRRATLRLEMVKEVDCSALYSCEVRTSDDQGNEHVQINRLHQRPEKHQDQTDGASVTSGVLIQQQAWLQQQMIQLGTSIDSKFKDLQEQWNDNIRDLDTRLDTKLGTFDVKFGVLERRLDALQDRLEDKIFLMHNEMGNKIETRVVDKLCQLEQRLPALDDEQNGHAHTLGEIKTILSSLETEIKDENQKSLKLNAVVISNNTREMVADVQGQMTEILTWEQKNQLRHNKLMEANKRIINSSEEMNHRLYSDFSNNYNNIHTEFEKLRAGVQNSSTETLSAVRDLIAATNTTMWNSLKPVVVDILSPKECKKGMFPTLLGTAFPYHVIQPDDDSVIDIPHLCDSVTNGGGWIVIQRRSSGVQNFYRNWAEYREGFGSLNGDFWWGNNNIHKLTSSGNYELRVDLKYNGQSKFAHYKSFSIDGENNNFVLHIGQYDGTAADSLSVHNGKSFSTHDRDNDGSYANTAAEYEGGWWYLPSGYYSNLNGRWATSGSDKAMVWYAITGWQKSVTFAEMKLRKL